MSIRNLQRALARLQKGNREFGVEVKSQYLISLARFTRIKTGALRGNYYVRRTPVRRFNVERKIRIPEVVARSQRRYMRPFGQDAISNPTPYGGYWERIDRNRSKAFAVLRGLIPGIVARTYRR